MAARPHVPQFGKWESEDDVPYTVYFDNARKGKGGKMINPNDPQENPDMFPDFAPSAPAPAPRPPSRTRAQAEEPMGRGGFRPPHEHRVSREDGNLRQFVDSPSRTDNTGRRTAGESAHHRDGHGSHSSRPSRQSAGSEHSFELSPLHSYHQAKVAGRGGISPARDGKNSYDTSHGTHGKSRMKPVTRGADTPDRGAAVPRFGDWDEKNPQSADNYTQMFNKVREERHSTPSNVSSNKYETTHMTHNQNNGGKRKGCCFPWLGK